MNRRDLGVSLIGCGRAGMIHALNFTKKVPGARIVAVSDVVEDAAKAAAAECRAEAWFTDYREMLLNPVWTRWWWSLRPTCTVKSCWIAQTPKNTCCARNPWQ